MTKKNCKLEVDMTTGGRMVCTTHEEDLMCVFNFPDGSIGYCCNAGIQRGSKIQTSYTQIDIDPQKGAQLTEKILRSSIQPTESCH